MLRKTRALAQTLLLDAKNAKALYRRGNAREGAGDVRLMSPGRVLRVLQWVGRRCELLNHWTFAVESRAEGSTQSSQVAAAEQPGTDALHVDLSRFA